MEMSSLVQQNHVAEFSFVVNLMPCHPHHCCFSASSPHFSKPGHLSVGLKSSEGSTNISSSAHGSSNAPHRFNQIVAGANRTANAPGNLRNGEPQQIGRL